MIIRLAVKDDAAKIAEAHIKAWCVGYQGILPDDYLDSLSIELRTKQWHESLVKDSIEVNFVIELNNVVSGFCVYGAARDDDLTDLNVGELIALNILPTAWNKGLGTELVKKVIASSSNIAWESLYLWVIKENNRARSFYESMGFEVEGLEKIDNSLKGCELHEIRYVKKLV